LSPSTPPRARLRGLGWDSSSSKILSRSIKGRSLFYQATTQERLSEFNYPWERTTPLLVPTEMNVQRILDLESDKMDLLSEHHAPTRREGMDNQLKGDYQRELKVPYKDSLTDLFAHGFFQVALESEVKRSNRHGNPFTLALIDVDSFSLYNRLEGHLQGDRLLRQIAALILQHLRESDVSARYSGDVFSVILVNSDSSSACLPMERIRKAVEGKEGGAATVSIGLASYP